jgi:ubiquinone/menaquinone biosynthesis C-methylase UbiE
MAEIFDEWPERYDQWFRTPIGRLVKEYESKLILEMLRPGHGERILDAGCGTGVFTLDMLSEGAHIVGLELSLPMLFRAKEKTEGHPLHMVLGDMKNLPFADNTFDKSISVTAIEFIKDARRAVGELFRVTEPGGRIVVATLNSLSPWATRRKVVGKMGHLIFKNVIFRSPDELKRLSPLDGTIKTAIHFQKHHDPKQAKIIEKHGQSKNLSTGAFLTARWEKPPDT